MTFDFKTASPEALKAEYKRIAQETGDDVFFTKKELKHLPSVLSDGEAVLSFASGMMDGNTWLIALTDRRVLLLDKGMITGLKQVSIDLDKVNSVTGKTGLILGDITVATGGPVHKITNVPKKTVLPFTNRMREAIEARKARNAPVAPAVAADADPIAKLERLSALKDKGILTEAEFNQQKALILNT